MIKKGASSWMVRAEQTAQEDELAGHEAKLAALEAELEERGHSMSAAKKSQTKKEINQARAHIARIKKGGGK